MAEKEGASCRDRRSSVDTEILMASYVEDNTSQGKDWIFDSSSTVHACSQKELFNDSLVAKEEEIVKMVDGSACEVIGTGTVKVTKRDETEGGPIFGCNLISIGVLDEEGC